MSGMIDLDPIHTNVDGANSASASRIENHEGTDGIARPEEAAQGTVGMMKCLRHQVAAACIMHCGTAVSVEHVRMMQAADDIKTQLSPDSLRLGCCCL